MASLDLTTEDVRGKEGEGGGRRGKEGVEGLNTWQYTILGTGTNLWILYNSIKHVFNGVFSFVSLGFGSPCRIKGSKPSWVR